MDNEYRVMVRNDVRYFGRGSWWWQIPSWEEVRSIKDLEKLEAQYQKELATEAFEQFEKDTGHG